MTSWKHFCTLVIVLAAATSLVPVMNADAGDAPKAPDAAKAPAKKPPSRYAQMDYGSFLSASYVIWPTAEFDNGPGSFTGDSVARGVSIKLTENWDAGIIFDMDTMRIAAGWIGSPLRQRGLIFDGAHGWDPGLNAPPLFQTPNSPGWADSTGSFKDLRADSISPLPRPGSLPKDWAHYTGLYRFGDQVVLSYTVGKCAVLETPSLESKGDVKALVRTIQAGASDVPMAVMLVDGNPDIPKPKNKKTEPAKAMTGTVNGNGAEFGPLHIGLVGAPDGAKLEINEQSQLVLKLPALKAAATFKVLIAGGAEAAQAGFADLLKDSPKPIDVSALTKGGPAKYTDPVETVGVVSTSAEPYVVDTITIPYENPWHSWMRIAAFDFFSDGTKAALSTWSGDVWIVTGIDDKLEHVKWKRFATGLHQPLGLKIVDDVIYVVGHDQITRLHDLNNDGEADYYENFNNDWQLTAAFHAFAFDLHTDPEGNFYFGFGSPVHAGGGGFQKITQHHGSILKISKDGSKMEVYATGLRAPNGMGMSPTGQVTIGDNEGSWVPSSPLHWVKPGQFLGVSDSAHGAKVEQPKPLFWLSHNGGVDNSTGGQAWVTSDKWGPFKGEMVHQSYGTSSLFLVLKEEVNGQMQGGAVKFPLKFTSSSMRSRFNPLDGQLYVTGLKGWQTNAALDGGFDRVRYTGKPVHMPKELHVTTKGANIKFTCSLDPSIANDAENYSVEIWNYNWTSAYGSPEVSTMPDKKKGHDTLVVKSAKLSEDGTTVALEIPDIKPAMQMRIKYKIKAADGTPINSEIHNTIYNLAP